VPGIPTIYINQNKKGFNMKKLLLLVTGLILSQLSLAHDYTCTHGSASRHISVEHEQGQELPCQVKYDKPDQASVEYPWRAQSTPGYCEEKAEYLASRLESFGWQCTEVDVVVVEEVVEVDEVEVMVVDEAVVEEAVVEEAVVEEVVVEE
jgi:hypothetical protein